MKKELIFIILILLSISFVSAEPVLNLNKQNFQPGETLLGNITGNFAKEISLNDIRFFQGKKQVFFEHDLVLFNNTYLFYIYLTRKGNFTIRINNILYREPELKSINIEKQIQVEENFLDENKTKTQILSIKPGFVFTSKTPEIILSNKGTEILDITYDLSEILLNPGEFETISFTPNQEFSYLKIESYEIFNIPIIYIPLSSNISNDSKLETNLKPDPSYLQLKVIEGQETKETIRLVNFGETNITDISINSNISILKFDKIKQIDAKSVSNLTLTFYSKKYGIFRGVLGIEFTENLTEKSIIIPIDVYVFPKNISDERFKIEKKSCEELNGRICNETQKCKNNNFTYTYLGEYCCQGICEDKTNGKNSKIKWIVFIIILFFIGIIGFLVFKKIKKTKSTPEEVLKNKSKSYEKRITGRLSRT